jgi:CHAD domain-containing protein
MTIDDPAVSAEPPTAPPVAAEEPALRPPSEGAPVAGVPPSDRLPLGPAPGPIALTDLLAAAGRKAMWVHLDRLLAREPGVRDPDRPDELRKYRVATRRLRAALRMFAAAYPDREVRPLRRGLSELARAVGAVRDLDNRIADLNRWQAERDGDAPAGVAVLTAAWAQDRQRAVHALYGDLDSRRHRRLVAALIAFVDVAPTSGRREQRPGSHSIHDRIASMLWAAYEDVRAFAPVLRWADLETVHELRIAGKRLRDDLEFLADLLPPERAWLLERLVALQDHLGALNDATVAASAIRAFLEHRHAGLAPVERAEISAYLVDKERQAAVLRRSIWRPWRPVAGIGFARRLSRLVVVRPAAV